ncbi:hypothetical protein BC936DRAFT_140825 [Jimgerdemannia flammicorona]|uniref:Uncharacterized protein n=1 Tax=Jimgerdemannia flammicorona TaxID=994334 RepID=A0A433DGI4_9FUNG|nr:hypothetical protein BC936DRAFT_140825 [Jimgerdemannia flammicorona]
MTRASCGAISTLRESSMTGPRKSPSWSTKTLRGDLLGSLSSNPKVLSNVRLIDLSRSNNIDASIVDLILPACHNLQILSLKDCPLVEVATLAHHLETLALRQDLVLPCLTKLQLQNDGRTSSSVVAADATSLATVRRCLELLRLPNRPSLFEEPEATDAEVHDPASSFYTEDPSSPCDLSVCPKCRNYYSAYTTRCSSCKEYAEPDKKQLCLVCQSFCDGCQTQYCGNCIRDHCQSVKCWCRLKDFAIMCYCESCKPTHSCVKCEDMWCEGGTFQSERGFTLQYTPLRSTSNRLSHIQPL